MIQKAQQTHDSTSPERLLADGAMLLVFPLFSLLLAISSAQAQT